MWGLTAEPTSPESVNKPLPWQSCLLNFAIMPWPWCWQGCVVSICPAALPHSTSPKGIRENPFPEKNQTKSSIMQADTGQGQPLLCSPHRMLPSNIPEESLMVLDTTPTTLTPGGFFTAHAPLSERGRGEKNREKLTVFNFFLQNFAHSFWAYGQKAIKFCSVQKQLRNI